MTGWTGGTGDGRPGRRGPTLAGLWTFLALALPALLGLLTITTTDTASAVAAGRTILETGAIPARDTLTFTVAGAPWVDQQWGAQLLLALLHAAGGWPLLVVARALLLAALAALLVRGCRAAGASARDAALVTLLGIVVALPNLALRAQLLAALLFAATWTLLLAARERPRLLAAIPLLAVAWANAHGTVWLGPLLVGSAWVDALLAERAARGTDAPPAAPRRPAPRALLATALLSAAAVLVNPWGAGIAGYTFAIGGSPVIRSVVSEWQPTWPATPLGIAYWLAVGAVLLLALVRFRRVGPEARRAGLAPGVGWGTAALLLLLVLLGATALRFTLWPILAAVPVAAALLAELRARTGRGAATARPAASARPPVERPVLNAAIAAGVVVAIVLTLPVDGRRSLARGPLVDDLPVEAASAIAASLTPADRLLVRQPWAPWFELEAAGVPTFIDARIELFPDPVIDDYLRAMAGGPEGLAVLDRWAVSVVVLDPGDPLAPTLAEATGWRTVQRDAGIVAFRRQIPVVTQ